MNCFVGKGYRNVILDAISETLKAGSNRSPRGLNTIEIQDVIINITNPKDRLPFIYHRNANIFSLIAETLWMIAGRNDLRFMNHFLPRLTEYSDDGLVVSGAYGPRIRSWKGHDQLKTIKTILEDDLDSRRAVISLFDPSSDHNQNRKDIPCNNWIQFSILQGKLNMRVTSRSMDAIWGSAINVFEWTVMQEMVAGWLNLGIGEYTHFIGSFHIYEDKLKRVQRMLNSSQWNDIYPTIPIDVGYESLDNNLGLVFQAEKESRKHGIINEMEINYNSLWLSLTTNMLSIYNDWVLKNDSLRAIDKLENLPYCDLTVAGIDYFKRKIK